MLEKDRPAPGESREFWTGCKRAQFSQSIKDGEGEAGEEAAFMDCTAALKEIEDASKAAAMAEDVALDEDEDAGVGAAGPAPDGGEEAGNAPLEEEAPLEDGGVGAEEDKEEEDDDEDDDEDPGEAPAGAAGLHNIFLTPAALKWVSTAETKYVNLFLRRVRQLASGQRSRILKKSLTGSKHAIWETYLDMKTAQRILWTEVIEEGDPAARAAAGAVAGTAGSSRKILIWYIARHDWVNRLMRKIDESGAKLNRRAARSANDVFEEEEEEGAEPDGPRAGVDAGADADADSEALRLGPEQMLIDPLSYVPLKLHQVDYGDLELLRNRRWSPPLRLTSTERAVIETRGSVLLLGRSGTGKTVCISSRISHDRQMCPPDAPLHQLFVSRNYRICRMVESLAGGEVNDQAAAAPRDALNDFQAERSARDAHSTSFMTFNKLLDRCTRVYAPELAQTHSMSRNAEAYVRFATFRDDFYAAHRGERGAGAAGVDALLVWTQIRSFICGSIEAVELSIRSGGVAPCVPLEAYLDREKFSAGRCRLTDEQRRAAYACFERYRKWKAENGLWDDSDRILGTLGAVIRSRQAAGDGGAGAPGAPGVVAFDRVYVDEVQDFTQAEIALFFLICGTGRLFLAGDMAQAVEQGVDFRFEEVRSVVFALSKGRERIDKPLTLTLNFRSHAGVLRLAAFVLDRLFAAFPTAAKKLPPDEGLFEGPRPGILEVMDPTELLQLCNRHGGLVCVTHDEHVEECAEMCGRNSLVLGIVEAKGLEFSDVVIVNFFSGLGGRHQAPWKELIRSSSRAGAAGALEDRHPELEGHLKLLYTAITRCCHRLFFVETAGSAAWPAFDRWLRGQGVAERCAATTDVDAALRTADEWRALGMDMALDKVVNDADAVFARRPNLMPNALKCFRNAGDAVLEKKADLHIRAAGVYEDVVVRAPAVGAKAHPRVCAALEELLRENLLYEAASLAAGVAGRMRRLDRGGSDSAAIHGLMQDWIVAAIQERLPQ